MKEEKEIVATAIKKDAEISSAILQLLEKKEMEPAEVIQTLSEKFDPWDVKEVIWELTAKAAAELTWQRKLKLGSANQMAAR